MSIVEFETQCEQVKHSFCVSCRGVGINISVNKKIMCKSCAKYKDPDFLLKKNALPIWYLDGVPQFHVPEELSSSIRNLDLCIWRMTCTYFSCSQKC
jgi:hypothetical protein